MTKELDLDTYLIITNYKFVICIFNKNSEKNLPHFNDNNLKESVWDYAYKAANIKDIGVI